MPNHVHQKLTVQGRPSDVLAFKLTARGAAPVTGDCPSSWASGSHPRAEMPLTVSDLCFHLIAPVDDVFSEGPYGDRASAGFHAERKAWGVKWGPYDEATPVYEEGGDRVIYEFTCAWSAPREAIRRASLRYPCLLFALSYGGEGPCRGRYAVRAGQVVQDRDDDWETEMEPLWPSAKDYESNEDGACARARALEYECINTHDAWVETLA